MLDRFNPDFQSAFFRENGNKLLEMHRNNRQLRMLYWGALNDLTQRELAEAAIKDGLVLEVGCGDNFFSHCLAPKWLQSRLVGFDINLPSLLTARKINQEAMLFNADANSLRLGKQTCVAAIGLSSFDSLPDLANVISRLAHVLKPGSPLLLIQDATTVLYSETLREIDASSVERYHQALVSALQQNSEFQIDFEGNVESVFVEPRTSIAERVKDSPYLLNIAKKLLVVGLDRGMFIACESEGDLIYIQNRFAIKQNLAERIKQDEVVEWVRLKVVRARKI